MVNDAFFNRVIDYCCINANVKIKVTERSILLDDLSRIFFDDLSYSAFDIFNFVYCRIGGDRWYKTKQIAINLGIPFDGNKIK